MARGEGKVWQEGRGRCGKRGGEGVARGEGKVWQEGRGRCGKRGGKVWQEGRGRCDKRGGEVVKISSERKGRPGERESEERERQA